MTEFLVDGMLGSLARKLRILGFDTIFDSKSSDSELLSIAERKKRCLVTSDVDLFILARRRHLDSILVKSRLERDRLFEVMSRVNVAKIGSSMNPRCSICNGSLADSGISRNEKPIFTCRECGKEYWEGSHWKKLSKLFEEVNTMLNSKRENAQHDN